MSYAKLLKDIREKRGFTQDHLATILCCTQSYISHIENGDIEPNKMLKQIIDDYVRRTKFKVK